MDRDLHPIVIEKISPIRDDKSDDIFFTCGSFEERFLGVSQKCQNIFSDRIIMFKYIEPNEKRENLIAEMEKKFKTEMLKEKYYKINVQHGDTAGSIIEFHKHCKYNNLLEKTLVITIDITTFTKGLLLNLLYYINNFLNVEKLRLLYTIPKNYASPSEGELSYGIKSLQILPFYWNGWSSIKDDLLIIILGYEELRAWSLINKFDANVNLLFTTRPGSIPKWDLYSEQFNEQLLKEIPKTEDVSALNPVDVKNILEKHITEDIIKKYNIFISPLGTKPQIFGIFSYLISNPKVPLNVITTTPIEHNIPYYSWGIGDTFQFFLPLKGKTKL